MPKLYKANDLVSLGVAFSQNKDLMKDQHDLIKKFYGHCYGHRFLLSHQDKQTLNTIFQQMEITRIFSGHLDLFKEIKRKEASLLAIKTLFDNEHPPEDISVNFDFENKVVIFLNKKS